MDQDINKSTNNILHAINHIVDKWVPLKKPSKRKLKLRQKPWLTNGIIKSIKNKQKLFKAYISDPLNQVKKSKYKKHSNLLNNLIKNSKKDYLTSQFEINKSNLKITWRLIGSIIKRNTKAQVSPSMIVHNNTEYTKKGDIANKLNEFFSSIGCDLASKIEDTGDDATSFIHNVPSSSFTLHPVTTTEIKQRLDSLNTKKISPDIPYYLIKIASDVLTEPVTYIINESIKKGVVPDAFKISCITPIFKSGDKTDPSNYRPISILPSLNKILERIIYDQILNYLDQHKILNNNQFGFRKNHSTELAILELTDNLRKSIDNKEITCGLFLDFSKAFDTVDHQILLSKLHKYGIRGNSYSWFLSYLSNRMQLVKIDDVKSDLTNISHGVPQGSTLGPLLFLLYINDLPNVSPILKVRMFADDTNLFYSHEDPAVVENVMNSEIKNILRYCATNKLTVNVKKTNFMIIKSNRKKIPHNFKLLDFEQKEYIKYLGIYIDQHLSWSKQIQFVQSKLSKNIGILRKLRYFVNLRTLRNLYFSLIYPYLSYGILTWGSTYKTKLTKICTNQNKCIRSIFFANQREHAAPLYNILDILTFQNIFKLKASILCYKIINVQAEVPQVFLGLITLAKVQHHYNTRYAASCNLVPPPVRTNYGKFTFKSTIIKIWEEIPTDLKIIKSIKLFKTQLQSFLISTQN